MLDDGTYTYTYDAAGNELTKTADVGGGYWTFGYDNANHIVSAVEKTSGGTTENTVTYEYDVFGNLTEEDINGTVTQYAVDGSMGNSAFDTWAVMNGSGVLETQNIDGNGINEHLASVSGGTASFYVVDHLGSIRNVLNSSFSVVSTVTYDAFGKAISGTPGEFGFAGTMRRRRGCTWIMRGCMIRRASGGYRRIRWDLTREIRIFIGM